MKLFKLKKILGLLWRMTTVVTLMLTSNAYASLDTPEPYTEGPPPIVTEIPSLTLTKTVSLLGDKWNLISIPLETRTSFDANVVFNGKGTIGYKFLTDQYAWEQWVPGKSLIINPGEGFFVGIPGGDTSAEFTAITGSYPKFEDQNYTVGKWYLIGFGYSIQTNDILKSYPNAVIWTMENGDYALKGANVTIEPGTGFWFKTKTAKVVSSSSSSSSSSSILSSSSVSSSSSSATMSSSSSSQNSTTIRTINDIVGYYTLESVYSKVSQVTLELNANDLTGSYMNIQSNGRFTMHLEIDEYGQSETTTATISSITDNTITAASNADDEGTIEYTFDGTHLTFIIRDYRAYIEYRWRLQ